MELCGGYTQENMAGTGNEWFQRILGYGTAREGQDLGEDQELGFDVLSLGIGEEYERCEAEFIGLYHSLLLSQVRRIDRRTTMLFCLLSMNRQDIDGTLQKATSALLRDTAGNVNKINPWQRNGSRM